MSGRKTGIIMEFNNCSLIILAGGKSSRMGQNKAHLRWNAKCFLDIIIEKGKSLGFGEIVLSGYRGKVSDCFSVEDELVVLGLMKIKKMYETPTSRAYEGIAGMLDKLAKYMKTTDITDGRDGNITSLVTAAKNFEQVRASFKGAFKDLQEEQESRVRGGKGLGYDQM